MFELKNRKRAGKTDDEPPETFDELSSIFRLVAIFELAQIGQWKYFRTFAKDKRPYLRTFTYFGIFFEIVRACCLAAIFFYLFLCRATLFQLSQPKTATISTLNTILLSYLWLSPLLILLIILQLILYQVRIGRYIAKWTALNFALSAYMITAVIPMFLIYFHQDVLVRESLFKTVNYLSWSQFHYLQGESLCCGFESPKDFGEKSVFLDFVEPLTNKHLRLNNDLSWGPQSGSLHILPYSCCKHYKQIGLSEHLSCVEKNATADINKARDRKDYDSLRIHFLSLDPFLKQIHTQGCIPKLKEELNHASIIILIILAIFTIFTCLTIGYVIILLLYEDSAGHMVSEDKMFNVDRNTGVNIAMNMDKKAEKNDEISADFSIIEFLRRSDLDKFFAADDYENKEHGKERK